MKLQQTLRMVRRGHVARTGLTLLELVIVIAIIAALAGIVVPLLPSMIYKTHASTGATNLSAIANAVQMYAAQNADNYPNQLDSIVCGTDVPDYVLHNTSLSGATLTDDDVSALSKIGITKVAPMVVKTDANKSVWNPTFNPYGVASGTSPTMTTLATGGSVAFLTPAVAAAKLGTVTTKTTTTTVEGVTTTTTNDNGRFVVFGLGKVATICGKSLNEAPVWFNPNEGQDPDSKYARFGLVFQTADADGAMSRAKFVGVVEFGSWGTMTKDDNLSYFYSWK